MNVDMEDKVEEDRNRVVVKGDNNHVTQWMNSMVLLLQMVLMMVAMTDS